MWTEHTPADAAGGSAPGSGPDRQGKTPGNTSSTSCSGDASPAGTSPTGDVTETPSTPSRSVVYSPSATESWLLCPMRAALEKTHRPRGASADQRDLDMLIGRAIHAGAAARMAGQHSPLDEAHRVLVEGYAEDDVHTLEGLKKLVAMGYTCLDEDFLTDCFRREQVVGVELTIGETRVDLVTRPAGLTSPDPGLVVTDYKVKRQLKADWIGKELKRWEASWQLRHEAWATHAYFGEEVLAARVVLVVLSPKLRVIVHQVDMGAEKILRWYHQAEQVWATMGRKQLPWMNTTSCDKFGGCPYHDFCHTCGGDPERAEMFYERIG